MKMKQFKDAEGWEPYLYSCPICGVEPEVPCTGMEDEYHEERRGVPGTAKPAEGIATHFEAITAERADTLLRRHINETAPVKDAPDGFTKGNRNRNQSRVVRYATEMIRGFWKVTHQGIAQDVDGYLIDGQTRLAAVIKANEWAAKEGLPPIVVTMMVTTGLDRDTFFMLDSGLSRSASQFLNGKYATQRAAVARVIGGLASNHGDGFASWNSVGKGIWPNHALVEFMERNPVLREADGPLKEAYIQVAQRATRRTKIGETNGKPFYKDSYFCGTSAVGLLVGGWLVGPGRREQWFQDIDALTRNPYTEGVTKANALRQFGETPAVGGNMTTVNYMRAIYIADRYRRGLGPKRLAEGHGERHLLGEWMRADALRIPVDVTGIDGSMLDDEERPRLAA